MHGDRRVMHGCSHKLLNRSWLTRETAFSLGTSVNHRETQKSFSYGFELMMYRMN
jgi:hypothetical protein